MKNAIHDPGFWVYLIQFNVHKSVVNKKWKEWFHQFTMKLSIKHLLLDWQTSKLKYSNLPGTWARSQGLPCWSKEPEFLKIKEKTSFFKTSFVYNFRNLRLSCACAAGELRQCAHALNTQLSSKQSILCVWVKCVNYISCHRIYMYVIKNA